MDPWEKTIGEVGGASLWVEISTDGGSDNIWRQRRGWLCRAVVFLIDVTLQNPTDIDASEDICMLVSSEESSPVGEFVGTWGANRVELLLPLQYSLLGGVVYTVNTLKRCWMHHRATSKLRFCSRKAMIPLQYHIYRLVMNVVLACRHVSHGNFFPEQKKERVYKLKPSLDLSQQQAQYKCKPLYLEAMTQQLVCRGNENSL